MEHPVQEFFSSRSAPPGAPPPSPPPSARRRRPHRKVSALALAVAGALVATPAAVAEYRSADAPAAVA
ncbi:hypothetical protein ICW40_10935, partial [Actinotalea ferrariae]|uniref:hypothetical protein n=1 Tax=Actinotalea ferrariae TaxID=1386098 RepID=UPI001C8C1D9B